MSQEETYIFKRATIVGPGLLGGSIGIGLKEKNIAKEVWATLRNQEKRDQCHKTTWCDRALLDLEESVKYSDLVILCTPVDTILEQIQIIANVTQPKCVVTDVGSLKKEICERADKAFINKPSYFVGSHPMAGSEKGGLEFGSLDLLKKKNCIITPTDHTNPDCRTRVLELWKRLGMRVKEINHVQHDKLVSSISHLPHVVASSLMNSMKILSDNDLGLAGNGLKDTTRIASGNPELWKQILLGNRNNLLQDLENIISDLNEIGSALKEGDEESLLSILQIAKKRRDQWNDKR